MLLLLTIVVAKSLKKRLDRSGIFLISTFRLPECFLIIRFEHWQTMRQQLLQ